MKKFMALFLAVAFVGRLMADVPVDSKAPKYGTPEWNEWKRAWSESKAAHRAGDYEKQAEVAPWSWVKAWAYYDAAGKLATGDKEDGKWNFGYQLDAETLAKVNSLLDKSEEAMNQAIKSGVIPESGPNIMEHLKMNIEHARKMLAE